MSTNPLESAVPRPDVSNLNYRGVQIANEKIAGYCNDIIDLAYEGIGAYLEADKEMHRRLEDEGFPSGEVVGIFVRQDSALTAPTRDSESQRTFCTRLEPADDEEGVSASDDADVLDEDTRPEKPQPNDGRYLKLHVPVGRLSVRGFTMPDRKSVTEVYVNTVDADERHWYGIGQGGFFYEYTPTPYEVGEQDLVIPERSIQSIERVAVPDTIDTITEIFKHINNWRTKPQILRIIK